MRLRIAFQKFDIGNFAKSGGSGMADGHSGGHGNRIVGSYSVRWNSRIQRFDGNGNFIWMGARGSEDGAV